MYSSGVERGRMDWSPFSYLLHVLFHCGWCLLGFSFFRYYMLCSHLFPLLFIGFPPTSVFFFCLLDSSPSIVVHWVFFYILCWWFGFFPLPFLFDGFLPYVLFVEISLYFRCCLFGFPILSMLFIGFFPKRPLLLIGFPLYPLFVHSFFWIIVSSFLFFIL